MNSELKKVAIEVKQEIKERIDKIKKGEVPKGYVQSKVGIVPQDWEVRKLKNIGFFLKGKGILKSEVIAEGVPCIRYGEIYTSHNNFIKEFKSFISRKVAIKSEQIYKGDMLFAGSGETQEDIGKSVAYLDSEEAYAGGDIVILRPKDSNNNSKYFGYALNSNIFNAQRRRLGQGHSVVHIYSKDLENIMIPIPTEEEQQKTTSILSAWDKAIELKEKLIEQKKEQKRGLRQVLLTGKVRLSGFEGEWKYIKAGDIFTNVTDKSHRGIGIVLSSTQDRGIIPRDDVDIDIKFDKGNLTSYKKVNKGEFVISLRSFQGGIEYSEFEGLLSPAYTILRNKIKIENSFYKHLFKSTDFITRLNGLIYGIRDGKQIGYKDFSVLKLPNPNIDEQRQIGKILDLAAQEINFLEQELEALKLQKKGLMQLLLTGIVRTVTEEG